MSINQLQINELDDIQEVQQQKFEITDLSSLTWVLRKLAAIEAKKTDVNQVADKEIERIEAYRHKELETMQHSETFFHGLINDYAIKRRMEDPKYKKDVTPYGSISYRKQQPKWNYDNDSVIAFLKENDYSDLLRVKEEPIKTDIKKRFRVNEDGQVFDENGQAVPGIQVEFMPEKLDVKVE